MSANSSQMQNAITLHLAGHLDQAETLYRSILQQNPRDSDALHLLGVIAKQKGHNEHAGALIQQAIELGQSNHNLADYYNNLGEVYRMQCLPEQALDCYQQAIMLRADFAPAIYNLGNCYQQLGNHRQALVLYEQTIALDPSHTRAQFARAMSWLSVQDYQKGWPAYENRMPQLVGQYYLTHPGEPDKLLPRPSTLTSTDWQNKNVLLLADQGIGDELFFLRYLPALLSMGVQADYQPSEKLAPLLERHPLLSIKHDEQYAGYDAMLSVGELPLITGMQNVSDIRPSLSLTPRNDIIIRFQQLFAELPRPWIGLTWRGGVLENLLKEIPLPVVLQLFQNMSGSLFILQRNPQFEEIELIKTRLNPIPLVDASDVNDDIEEALAMLDLLDHYVTVSNTNVHLRAALGKGSEVLLPLVVDFRWPNTCDNSPWFPDCNAYRQAFDGSWDEALHHLQQHILSIQ